MTTEFSGERIRILGAMRRAFLRGLGALLPVVLTIFILVKVAQFVYAYVAVPMSIAIEFILKKIPGIDEASITGLFERGSVKVLGFFVAVMLVMLVGALVLRAVGRRLLAFFERHLERLPIVKQIYPRVKQLSDFLFTKPKMKEFRQVVAVEYPRKGLYSLGFVTSEGLSELDAKTQNRYVSVFIPSSPTPLTGWVLFVPARELIRLSLSPEEVFPLLISGGVIRPAEKTDRHQRMPAPPKVIED